MKMQIQNFSVKTWRRAFPSVSHGAGQGLAGAGKRFLIFSNLYDTYMIDGQGLAGAEKIN